MKHITKILIVASAIFVAGCSQPNPAYTTSTVSPTGTTIIVTNPAVPPVLYTEPPSFASISNEIQTLVPIATGIAAATPIAPIAPAIPAAVTYGLGLLSAIFAAIAAWKNNEANAQALAAKSLATTVTSGSLQGAALANAPSPAIAATIATHLAS